MPPIRGHTFLYTFIADEEDARAEGAPTEHTAADDDADDTDMPPLVEPPAPSQASMMSALDFSAVAFAAPPFAFAPASSAVFPADTPTPTKHAAAHIPRPPNAFILFRSSFIRSQAAHAALAAAQGGGSSSLSKLIGRRWRDLPPEERARWEDKARAAQAEHRRRYPDWRFRPGNGKNGSASNISSPAGGGGNPKGRRKGRIKDGGATPDREKDGEKEREREREEEGEVTRGRRPARGRAAGKGKGKAREPSEEVPATGKGKERATAPEASPDGDAKPGRALSGERTAKRQRQRHAPSLSLSLSLSASASGSPLPHPPPTPSPLASPFLGLSPPQHRLMSASADASPVAGAAYASPVPAQAGASPAGASPAGASPVGAGGGAGGAGGSGLMLPPLTQLYKRSLSAPANGRVGMWPAPLSPLAPVAGPAPAPVFGPGPGVEGPGVYVAPPAYVEPQPPQAESDAFPHQGGFQHHPQHRPRYLPAAGPAAGYVPGHGHARRDTVSLPLGPLYAPAPAPPAQDGHAHPHPGFASADPSSATTSNSPLSPGESAWADRGVSAFAEYTRAPSPVRALSPPPSPYASPPYAYAARPPASGSGGTSPAISRFSTLAGWAGGGGAGAATPAAVPVSQVAAAAQSPAPQLSPPPPPVRTSGWYRPPPPLGLQTRSWDGGAGGGAGPSSGWGHGHGYGYGAYEDG
ncbi:HMG box domain-containing protein [Mycena indigotica]|uniref:HMG box domain-containing protein n=1 Tax=Mycena indigotica TaxID=2126181 RepID=A0A8H6S3P9_9AGAR|nr:HMG box domain-containing protein [Mycena indigotica]KAF7292138.1 HMG box domain-containing protein [Mycena indigotica]